jgi:hypothetical protein
MLGVLLVLLKVLLFDQSAIHMFLSKTHSAGEVLRIMPEHGESLSLPKARSAGEVLRIGSTFVDGDIPSDPIVIFLACAFADHFASSPARGMQVRAGIPKPSVRAPVRAAL